ncbi:uncharacterized protein LOC100208039 [Hydra vulgaris]|uniref:uncharacterized protein LOC100208039 n=1 Tax=Hydra vulgaris TaxID=6087 RepID=UPI001F5EEEEB|nr:uncharacterized protein LOC100208039 [Hydra vulgaris]
MSYVFSKALQQQKSPTEERQRRKTLPTGWDTPVSPNLDHVTAERIPPIVAPKPKQDNTDQTKAAQNLSGASKSAAFRNAGSRSFSFDSEASAGPKMGGAFARLQANLENPNTTTNSIYSEKYEAYRIQRSLKEHGVLPSELRSNEQLQKYGLDKMEPPKVLPKPSRGSVENKRSAFSKNRSETMPSPSITTEESFYHKNKSFGSLDNNDLIISEEHFTKLTPDTSEKETQPETKATDDVFVCENNEIVNGQRQLNETIEELEKMSFELDSKKGGLFFEKVENEKIHSQVILESDAIQQDGKKVQDEVSGELPPDSVALSLSKPNQASNEIQFSKVSDELNAQDVKADSVEFLYETVDNSVELINLQKDNEKSVTDLANSNSKTDQTVGIPNLPTEHIESKESHLDDLSTDISAIDFNRVESCNVEELSLTNAAVKDEVPPTHVLVDKEASLTNAVVEEVSPLYNQETVFLNKNELEENLVESPIIDLESSNRLDDPVTRLSDPLLEIKSEMNLTQEISALLETNLFSNSPLESDFSLDQTNDHPNSKEELENAVKIYETSDKPFVLQSDSVNELPSHQIVTEINPEHTVDSFKNGFQESEKYQIKADVDVEITNEQSLLKNELKDESDGVVKTEKDIDDVNNNSSFNFDTAF